MITAVSCADNDVTLLSAAKKRSVAIIYTFAAATVYVSLDGSSDVTGPSGARPGYPVTAGQPIALHSPTAPGEFDAAIYVRNDTGAAVDVVIQER